MCRRALHPVAGGLLNRNTIWCSNQPHHKLDFLKMEHQYSETLCSYGYSYLHGCHPVSSCIFLKPEHQWLRHYLNSRAYQNGTSYDYCQKKRQQKSMSSMTWILTWRQFSVSYCLDFYAPFL